MIHLGFDTQIHAGDLLVSGMLGALGYGLRRSYMLAAHFVNRVNGNEDQLHQTSKMVDEHSRAMLRAGLLESPVSRVHQYRRATDPTLIDVEDEIRL